MNILLIGGGGREHALAYKIKSSTLCDELFIAPGNPGMGDLGELVDLNIDDETKLIDFLTQKKIEIVLVGPEQALVDGIADRIHEALPEIFVVGPAKSGARLEGSKSFSKQFMKKYGIPTARYLDCTVENLEEGIAFLKGMSAPYVLKADGLAAGKGVLIIDDLDNAIDSLRAMLSGMFGAASNTVVIEEFLSGIEFSVFALVHNDSWVVLPEAKDYKRIWDGDAGKNTGGMGAVSPVNFVDKLLIEKVSERIIKPTVMGLQKENIPYTGFIFFGLINVNLEPYVIEYNCRMGDPETQSVMTRLDSDLVEAFVLMKKNQLSEYPLKVKPETAVTVMVASGGYPGSYEKGFQISLPTFPNDVHLFHSGTAQGSSDKTVVTNGGRVLAVTAMAENLSLAIEKAYRHVNQVDFKGKYHRTDIGNDLLRLEKNHFRK
jgi:phosphoribosylamine---glycine ligase